MIGWDYIPAVNFPVPDLTLQEILTANRFTLGLATPSRPFARVHGESTTLTKTQSRPTMRPQTDATQWRPTLTTALKGEPETG